MRAIWFAIALLATPEWRVAVDDYPWSFPEDHWAHDGYRTEWWYFTGHLHTGDVSRPRFAYQFTFFRIGITEERPALDSAWVTSSAIMGHAAVTDLSTGRHVFSEVLHREIPLLAAFEEHPAERIGWSRAPAGTKALWWLDWSGEGFELSAADDRQGMSFRLTTRIDDAVVFQGPLGLSRKADSENAASQYYSFTRLPTEGTLTWDGERFDVRGTSWMDKEFSSSHLADHQAGWDWFSLRLDDGRDLMLYLMRASDGSVDFASGTLVDPTGSDRVVYLDEDDFEVSVLGHWSSPSTGARYPSRWRIRLDSGLTLEVRAAVPDQENRSRLPGGVYYWEGAVEIDGRATGVGFVELTGYGEGNRPPV